jgi:hypothetical protein
MFFQFVDVLDDIVDVFFQFDVSDDIVDVFPVC